MAAFAAFAAIAEGVETFLTTREAVARMIPGAVRYTVVRYTLTGEEAARIKSRWNVELPTDREYAFFFGWSPQASLLGAVSIDEEMGKHGLIKIAVGLDATGTVKDLAVMQYQEVRGRPVRERAYLEQYIGKNASSPLQLGTDIQGLTGATFSSRAVTVITKNAVVLFQVLVLGRGITPPE